MTDVQAAIHQTNEWDPSAPPDRNALQAAEQKLGRAFPADVRALYSLCNAAYHRLVGYFTPDEASDVTTQLASDAPGMVFFASDGGDGLFAIDEDGAASDPGSILWLDRAAPVPADGIVCAADLGSFILQVDTGERAWENRQSIRAERIRRLLAALEAAGTAWIPAPPAGPVEINAASDRLGNRPADELVELLYVADGAHFPAAGVTVYPTDRLSVVPGARTVHDLPGAIWFAEDDIGTRYAVTAPGFREPSGGEVIRVSPVAEPLRAPLIGTLPDVVIGWAHAREATP